MTLTQKFSLKSCSTIHLYHRFLSSYPKILKAFAKTFPTEMKLTNITIYAQQKKIMRQEMQKKRGRGKAKTKSFKTLLSSHASYFASGSEGHEVQRTTCKWIPVSPHLSYCREKELPLTPFKGHHIYWCTGCQCCINHIWVFEPHIGT